MSQRRKHRGPHPEDQRLFCSKALPGLQAVTAELSWLWTRGYAAKSSLKLVGDRHALDSRQQVAVGRCACSDQELARRQRHEVGTMELRNQELWIDGFNVLTSIEAALSGGVILQARDGCYRDMASMYGNYRRVDETFRAIGLLGASIAHLDVKACHWLLDEAVSNSGRLKTMLRVAAEENGYRWQIDLISDPDPVLIRSDQIVASSDSEILNQTDRWFNLARCVIDAHVPGGWCVNLAGDAKPE